MAKVVSRCEWAVDPLNAVYHDKEWGKPVYDDKVFFEFILLEGAQAGLNWLTVLKKREGYRKNFCRFDPVKVSKLKRPYLEKILKDESIIRHRGKVESAVTNAQAFLAIQKEFGSFSKYVWSFVDGKPVVNRPRTLKQISTKSDLSDRLSKDLKKRGFKFVGSTICYAFLQACGLVNDHTQKCFLCPTKN